MTRWFIGLALAVGLVLQTSQAHALALWRGLVKVESATSQCDSGGFQFFVEGEEKPLFFLPAGITDNGPDTNVSIGNSSYFASMKITGGGMSSGALFKTTAIDPFGNLIRKPAVITSTTKTVEVFMVLQNVRGENCTIHVRAGLVRR